jgi:hypothetical protein
VTTKYIISKDATIEGHTVPSYYVENSNGKGGFVIFSDNVAHRFATRGEALTALDKMVLERGYKGEIMKVIEVSTEATMVMPL